MKTQVVALALLLVPAASSRGAENGGERRRENGEQEQQRRKLAETPSPTTKKVLSFKEVIKHKTHRPTPTPTRTPAPTRMATPTTQTPTRQPSVAPPTSHPTYAAVPLVYLGCYQDDVFDRALVGYCDYYRNQNSPRDCAGLCFEHGYEIAGLENGRECLCGQSDQYEKYGEADNCNMPCTGDATEVCGGDSALSIWRLTSGSPTPSASPSPATSHPTYASVPIEYRGCYRDNVFVRALAGHCDYYRAQNSPTDCAGLCFEHGYNIAGLENGRECLCGQDDQYEKYGTANNCDMACTGDPTKTCGGDSALSIWQLTGVTRRPSPAPTPAGPSPSPTPPTPPTSYPTYAAVPMEYIGCYRDNVFDRALVGHCDYFRPYNTPTDCAGICFEYGYNIAGLEYGRECLCGQDDQYEKYGEANNCDMACTGDPTKTCGGDSALSIWQLTGVTRRPSPAPTPLAPPSPATSQPTHAPIPMEYRGCFRDNVFDRALEGQCDYFRANNSPADCAGYCYDYGYNIAGLGYGRECLCGQDDQYNKYGPAENCDMPCTGDVTMTCGGDSALSIWQLTDVTRRPSPAPLPGSPSPAPVVSGQSTPMPAAQTSPALTTPCDCTSGLSDMVKTQMCSLDFSMYCDASCALGGMWCDAFGYAGCRFCSLSCALWPPGTCVECPPDAADMSEWCHTHAPTAAPTSSPTAAPTAAPSAAVGLFI
ncbi:unnamed protein product [Phaeothamnion confervicola]